VITGKGDKERLVFLNGRARDALTLYLPHRSVFVSKTKHNSWLFPSRGVTGHLTRQRVGQLLKSLALQAGLDPRQVSPHVVRHAFATHLLHRGADLISLQHLLGHADIATTEIYTHLNPTQLFHDLKKHHPLSKNK
jgi:integrase/recombinase XerD